VDTMSFHVDLGKENWGKLTWSDWESRRKKKGGTDEGNGFQKRPQRNGCGRVRRCPQYR